jgi:hypothetical protein
MGRAEPSKARATSPFPAPDGGLARARGPGEREAAVGSGGERGSQSTSSRGLELDLLPLQGAVGASRPRRTRSCPARRPCRSRVGSSRRPRGHRRAPPQRDPTEIASSPPIGSGEAISPVIPIRVERISPSAAASRRGESPSIGERRSSSRRIDGQNVGARRAAGLGEDLCADAELVGPPSVHATSAVRIRSSRRRDACAAGRPMGASTRGGSPDVARPTRGGSSGGASEDLGSGSSVDSFESALASRSGIVRRRARLAAGRRGGPARRRAPALPRPRSRGGSGRSSLRPSSGASRVRDRDRPVSRSSWSRRSPRDRTTGRTRRGPRCGGPSRRRRSGCRSRRSGRRRSDGHRERLHGSDRPRAACLRHRRYGGGGGLPHASRARRSRRARPRSR